MGQTLVVVSGEGLGRGDDELGRRLMVKFFAQLMSLGSRPQAVAFYNAGVKLLVHGSPITDALKALDHDGAELVACGTCVDHFGVRAHLAIGRVSDMREIVALMDAADKVVTV